MKSLPPFARVIKEQRDRLGLSRAQLAEASELSYPYISQLETGLRKPSRNAARAIASALGISVEDLERTIPGDVNDRSEMAQAERFSDQFLSQRSAAAIKPQRAASGSASVVPTVGPDSREDLVGNIIELLEAFEPEERLDALSDVQKRVMQGILDARR